VYWTRRILALSLALLLVLGIATVLNAATDASSEQPPTAKRAGADLDEQPLPTPFASIELTKDQKKLLRKLRKARETPVVAVPAEPEGPCDPADIVVSPYVYRAVAWRFSYILLDLKTKESPACTWRTSPNTITLRVTGDKGEVWTSRDCPISVPRKDLVLRNTEGVKIAVVWSGRRSDTRCTGTTPWAPPGWYRVQAAAFAGEPGELLFQLQRPEPKILTQAPEPTDPPVDGEGTPTEEPLAPAGTEPSGAVEPD
jgi:hypothetical protein